MSDDYVKDCDPYITIFYNIWYVINSIACKVYIIHNWKQITFKDIKQEKERASRLKFFLLPRLIYVNFAKQKNLYKKLMSKELIKTWTSEYSASIKVNRFWNVLKGIIKKHGWILDNYKNKGYFLLGMFDVYFWWYFFLMCRLNKQYISW